MTSVSADLRHTRLAVAGAFAVQGLLFAVLLTHLPSFKDRYGIGDGAVTGLILGVTVLAGGGSVAAGALAERIGSARTLRVALLGVGLMTAVIGLDVGPAVFVAAFALYGFALGAVDAAGNMQAVAVEHRYGRSILTSFHAAWSAAGILGALWTWSSDRMDLGLTTTITLASTAALALVVGSWRALAAPDDVGAAGASGAAGGTGTASTGDTDARGLGTLWRPLVLLGTAMACVYVADSGISSWSSIYLHDTLLASAGTAALGYAAYQATALAARVAGDHAVRRWRARPVVATGAVLGTSGLFLVVLAPTVPVAVTGFALTGLGLGVVAPLCFAAVGSLAPGAADGMIVWVNLFNYVGAIGGGVLVGGIGTVTSLRAGFVVALVAAAAIVVLAPAFAPRPTVPQRAAT